MSQWIQHKHDPHGEKWELHEGEYNAQLKSDWAVHGKRPGELHFLIRADTQTDTVTTYNIEDNG